MFTARGTSTEDAIMIIKALIMSNMLATLSPIINITPLIKSMNPNAKMKFAGIQCSTAYTQKHMAMKMSKIPSSLTIIGFLK